MSWIRQEQELDLLFLQEEQNEMKHDKWVKAQQEAQAMLDWARQSEEADWIRETARAYAVELDAECEESEMGLPIPLSLLQIPITMEDEPVHTDDHPFCDDKMCPCHANFEAVWLLTTQRSFGLMTPDETLRLYRGENV